MLAAKRRESLVTLYSGLTLGLAAGTCTRHLMLRSAERTRHHRKACYNYMHYKMRFVYNMNFMID